MKEYSYSSSVRSLSTALAAGALVLLTLAGCSKSERENASAKVSDTSAKVGDSIKEAYQDSKSAAVKAWDNVASYTYDKRTEFSASAKAMTASMDAQVSALNARYSEATASASRKAAMSELKNSQADYRAKVDALGTATADTWDSAKQNVVAAWDKLQASYYKARAD